LEVKNLSVLYEGAPALKKISFTLQRGEILCIVGESGSGKSTLLRALAGLLPGGARKTGEILFKGRDLTKLSERELNRIRGKEIGFIFQEPSLYLDPLYRVGDQIAETCRIHGGTGCRQKALNALRRAGITDPERIYRAYPHRLSGGQKQRVMIADATVNDPDLLLADEPTTALDLPTQRKILSLFKKLKRENRSVILVTHDLGVVWDVADRVVVLREGEKVEEGTPGQIYLNPRKPYTRTLVEAYKKIADI